MDPLHQEVQAADLAGNEKRKSTCALEHARPAKRANIELGDGQISEGQQAVRPRMSDEATLLAEVRDLERRLENQERPKKNSQALEAKNPDVEMLLQVHIAFDPSSMHEQIAKFLRLPEFDDFWQMLITREINKRRLKLFEQLPILGDSQLLGEHDELHQNMSSIRSTLEFEVADNTHGYLSAVDELTEENGFRQAVMDYILTRLCEKAEDPMLECIRDPSLAIKFTETNFEKLAMDATARLRKRKQEIMERLSFEGIAADQTRDEEQLGRVQELESLTESYRGNVQALGYEVKVVPSFDIKLLLSILDKSSQDWDQYKGRAESCDIRFQIRLCSLIIFMHTASDIVMKDRTLGLMEEYLAPNPT